MKKSKYVSLVLITAALASCNKDKDKEKEGSRQKVYMRSDSTAPYSRAYVHHSPFLWYYAFRPYGYYSYNGYSRAGYYSGGISERANVGGNIRKSGIMRGGFGRGYSVSS
jgi:hypothetical protein